MDEGRLGAVRRQQDHHRKSTIVMNDIINFQQNVYTCYLKRERQSTEAKLKAQEVFLKRSLVRNSYLLQCLEARKEKIAERAPEKQIYGRYGGRPIHAFSRDVDDCISWMHPRLRRLRRVERAKERGKKLGAIMDFTTIPAKMEAIFQKTPEKNNNNSDTTSSAKEESAANILRGPNSKFRIARIRNQSFGVPDALKNRHGIHSNESLPAQNDVHEENPRDLDRVGHSDSPSNKKELPQNNSHDNIDQLENDNKNGDKENDDGNNASNNNNLSDDDKINKSIPLPLSQKKALQDPEVDTAAGEKPKVTESASLPPPLVRRPTLILPPIKTTKEMKLRGFEGL